MRPLLAVPCVLALTTRQASAHGGCTGAECTHEPPDSKVTVLNPSNYHRFINKNPLVLMEFYAPWCGHCQNLGPHFREAAAKLADMDLPEPVVLAKIDDGKEENRVLRAGAEEMYNYTSYPTLILFRGDSGGTNAQTAKCKYKEGDNKPGAAIHPGTRKDCWEFYGGGREAEDIIFWMSTVAKGLNPFEEEAKNKPGLYKGDKKTAVVDLDPDNFDGHVFGGNKLWIVEFYSDRCPICKGLVPEVKKAATTTMAEYPGEIAFGGCNSRVYMELAEKWGIGSYPWVASFYKGKKLEDMAGLGGWESIYNWAKAQHAANWKPDKDQVLACKTLGKTAIKVSSIEKGATVNIVSDEAMVKQCIEEKGKQWEGKMKNKRGKYIGNSATVVETDTKKDAVLLEFDDKTQMWWGALYLTAATKEEL